MQGMFDIIPLDIIAGIGTLALVICGIVSCIKECNCEEEEKGPSPSPLLTVEEKNKWRTNWRSKKDFIYEIV